MLFSYGVTVQGADHKKEGTVCQDSHEIRKCSEKLIIAAVADGLGTEKYSDIASRIAAECAVEYCEGRIRETDDEDKVLSVIRQAFDLSLRKIRDEAQNEEHDENQYDTTLSLAILIGDELYVGHSGDSGIIALCRDGRYEAVTQQQRDDYDHVFPLACTDRWEFFRFKKRVSSVLLATDGIYEIFTPYVLRDQAEPFYVLLGEFFMNPRILFENNQTENDVQSMMEEIIADLSEEAVTDDKTLVVIGQIDNTPDRQPDDYYAMPDWENLERSKKEKFRREAYPSLYEKSEDELIE